MAPGPITSRQIEEEKVEVVTDFLFLGSKITVDGDCSHKKEGDCFLAGKCAEKQRRYSADKGLYSQGHGLPSGHVWL